MDSLRPRYSKEEFARRGEEIFERDIRAQLEGVPRNHFVAIDIETGAFEVDEDEMAASNRLLARNPQAQTWLRRAGSPFVCHFGFHF
jgi:hypothetical protein